MLRVVCHSSIDTLTAHEMLKPDIQPIVGALAQCILMRERWAAGCLYLHDTGDDEAAREAMEESDRWWDRADHIQEFMRNGQPSA